MVTYINTANVSVKLIRDTTIEEIMSNVDLIECHNVACDKKVDASNGAGATCPFCHKAVFCNDACMSEGFTEHQEDCNVTYAPNAHAVPAVPSAWQAQASPAQWRTQNEAFPAYMTQYRDAAGCITQTIVPAVDSPASQLPEKLAQQVEHIDPHVFSVKVDYYASAKPDAYGADVSSKPVSSAVYDNLNAPDNMIYTNSSLNRAASLAHSRNSNGYGMTYWVGPQHTLKVANNVVSVPDTRDLPVPGRVCVQLTSELHKTPIVVDALLTPPDHFDEQVRSKLGHHLRQHLQMQYKHKGLGAGNALATYTAFNTETGARATLTFDRSTRDTDGRATLVDVEMFVPMREHPIRFQREQFDHTIDVHNINEVQALVDGVKERLGDAEEQLETEGRHNSNPDNETLLTLRECVQDLQHKLGILERHRDALAKQPSARSAGADGIGNDMTISADVASTINESLSVLWQPIDARPQRYYTEMMASARWYERGKQTADSLAMAIVKRRDELQKLENERDRRRGVFRRGFARTRAAYVRKQLKEKEKDLRKLQSAVSNKRQNITNALTSAGIPSDSPTWYAKGSDYSKVVDLENYIRAVLNEQYEGSVEQYRASEESRRLRFQGKEGGFQERGRAWLNRAKERFGRGGDDVDPEEAEGYSYGGSGYPEEDEDVYY